MSWNISDHEQIAATAVVNPKFLCHHASGFASLYQKVHIVSSQIVNENLRFGALSDGDHMLWSRVAPCVYITNSLCFNLDRTTLLQPSLDQASCRRLLSSDRLLAPKAVVYYIDNGCCVAHIFGNYSDTYKIIIAGRLLSLDAVIYEKT
jgi:hypothetical protein